MSKKILGAVLCGGQSKRMGTDKGLLTIEDCTWAEYTVNKLVACNLEVVISINQNQQNTYKTLFNEEQLVVDGLDIGGPMNGLLSIHQQFPGSDLLLVACDMIEMQPSLIKALIERYEKNNAEYEYYAYEVEEVVQPFCAIYTAAALASLLQKYKEQTLGSSSLRYTLEQSNTRRIVTEDALPFTNYNTLDERKS